MSDQVPQKCVMAYDGPNNFERPNCSCKSPCKGVLFMPVYLFWSLGFDKTKVEPWPVRPEIALCAVHKEAEIQQREFLQGVAGPLTMVMMAHGLMAGPNLETAEIRWEEPRSLTQIAQNERPFDHFFPKGE